jgi:ATP-dependent Clp protease adaptor protein ClpS
MAMTQTTTEVESPAEQGPAPMPEKKRKTKPQNATKPKIQPPYAVILHNDPINGFEYVIGVLRRVFRYGGLRAFVLTLRAHLRGRSVVWTGSLEVAELKAAQIHAAGPDPKKIRKGAQPLGVTLEALPV